KRPENMAPRFVRLVEIERAEIHVMASEPVKWVVQFPVEESNSERILVEGSVTADHSTRVRQTIRLSRRGRHQHQSWRFNSARGQNDCFCLLYDLIASFIHIEDAARAAILSD